jgi:hypothetical protein
LRVLEEQFERVRRGQLGLKRDMLEQVHAL